MSKSPRQLIEAILFATPEGLTIEQVSERTGLSKDRCRSVLRELEKAKQDDAVKVVFEGSKWRMRISRELTDEVRKMVPIQSELSSSLVKTLAVIALKAPVKQSDVVHIRGNKAYNHVSKLEELGFIASKPHSRTKMLSLKQRFYDYFDIRKGEEKYLFEQK